MQTFREQPEALLTKRIMRRVYWHWFWKRQAPSWGGQLAVLAFLLVGIHEFVSIKFVFANAVESASGVKSLIDFAVAGFRNTGFVPQLLFGASFMLGILLARDFIRAAASLRPRQVLRQKVLA